MARGVKLIKSKTIYPLKKFLEPKIIYMPLIIHKDEDITILVQKGDYVLKGEMIAKSKGNFRTPIHASVSGKVIDFVEKYYLNNKKIKCIAIENDFLEKTKQQNVYTFKDYNKEQAINRLKENGIIGLSGSGFPTHIKYDNKLTSLIVNAMESDPYTSADFKMLEEKCEEILETVDALVEIFGLKEAIIAIKKDNFKLKKTLTSFIGSYTKLRIGEAPNYYIMGWEQKLVETIKKISCKTYPTDKGIVVSNVSTIYAIYEALIFNKPLIERMVTFSGSQIKEGANVYLKIGTPVNEVISFLGGYQEELKMIIANGPLMGYSVESDELVVSSDMTSVCVVKQIEEDEETTCFHCGECVAVCPAKLSPVLIKESISSENLYPEKCIECGLCSYVCPAKINVRKKVKEKKDEAKNI